MTLGVAAGEYRGKVFQLGEARALEEPAVLRLNEAVQDDGGAGVKKVYKLVPKSSKNERWQVTVMKRRKGQYL